MRSKRYAVYVFALSFLLLLSESFVAHAKEYGEEVRYIKNNRQVPDIGYQHELRSSLVWQNFLKNNGTWYVIYNEENAKPHRAFGKPIPVFGPDAKSKALNFINSKLQEFKIPVGDLNFVNVTRSEAYEQVFFHQQYHGMEVLNSQFTVKFTLDGRAVFFGADVFDDIHIERTPLVSVSVALENAKQGLHHVLHSRVQPELKVLPVPQNKKNIYRLVYEVSVETRNAEKIPGNYYVLVDAVSGEILYRNNRVLFHGKTKKSGAAVDVNAKGTVYPTNPNNPVTIKPLVNLKITTASNTYYTDSLGAVSLPDLAPVTATITLEGKWSKVNVNDSTPGYNNIVLSPGANSISFDTISSVQARSGYYHVNIVHDYMKTKFPAFIDMDNPLPTNIDLTAATCNAYYDGNSINFFAKGGGCNSLAQVGDVVYHEYGHGINDKFYKSIGGNFQNGAMHEGYADIWAMGITEDPVLGYGFFENNPTGFVRRYDVNRKVYPQDLVGEEHADGEIIAGAWWDLGIKFGNVQKMIHLFKETFYGKITGADGAEGKVFTDILIEALQCDDVTGNGGDNDITNGTPNDLAIVEAFDMHGITLVSNAKVEHTPLLASPAMQPITIDAAVNGAYPWTLKSVKLFYKLNRTGTWNMMSMPLQSGIQYKAIIPSQPKGTVIAYYLGLEDRYGKVSGIQPLAANAVDANVPYFILNGFNLIKREDFEADHNGWVAGLPTDNATAGNWLIDVPIPSYTSGNQDPKTMVQPLEQHTAGGGYCAVTGNAPSSTDPAGTQDIDGGETTLESAAFDLSQYANPVIAYHRWFTNFQGSNPGTDPWEVEISADGNSWIKVERTFTSDKSWRRYAFRVKDYVALSAAVKIRFIAEDSLNNGGSLIEAALDDVELYEEWDLNAVEESHSMIGVLAYPNPATDHLMVDIALLRSDHVILELNNLLGQQVYNSEQKLEAGRSSIKINTNELPAGIYLLNIKTASTSKQQKVNLVK